LLLVAGTTFAADVIINPTTDPATIEASDLSDVADLSGAAADDVLTYNGATWTNAAASGGGGSSGLPIISANLTKSISTSETYADVYEWATNNAGYIDSTNVTVTFDWDDGAHSYGAPFELSTIRACFVGPGRVRFLGNATTHTLCNIRFTDSSGDGFISRGGVTIEDFGGFNVESVGIADSGNVGLIHAKEHSTILFTDDVTAHTHRWPIMASEFSYIDASYATASNGHWGISAHDNSAVYCPSSSVLHCVAAGYGADHAGTVIADYGHAAWNTNGCTISSGSYMRWRYGSSHSNLQYNAWLFNTSRCDLRNFDSGWAGSHGIRMENGCQGYGENLSSHDNAGSGVVLSRHCSLSASGGDCSDNGNWGWNAARMSYILPGTASDNVSGSLSPSANTEGNQNSYMD